LQAQLCISISSIKIAKLSIVKIGFLNEIQIALFGTELVNCLVNKLQWGLITI
jgi:hypothetical protein